jgi:hypothetical protein
MPEAFATSSAVAQRESLALTLYRGDAHVVIAQLIGSTTTEKGLKVYCELDTNHYPKGVKVTDREMNQINISYDEFHGEWGIIS